MSELNPYEKFLDGRPLKTILSATPGTIAVLLEKRDPAKVTAPPAPGKWRNTLSITASSSRTASEPPTARTTSASARICSAKVLIQALTSSLVTIR